jgi:hypothetical protein
MSIAKNMIITLFLISPAINAYDAYLFTSLFTSSAADPSNLFVTVPENIARKIGFSKIDKADILRGTIGLEFFFPNPDDLLSKTRMLFLDKTFDDFKKLSLVLDFSKIEKLTNKDIRNTVKNISLSQDLLSIESIDVFKKKIEGMRWKSPERPGVTGGYAQGQEYLILSVAEKIEGDGDGGGNDMQKILKKPYVFILIKLEDDLYKKIFGFEKNRLK